MSDLVVQPVVIEAIKPHPNADKLEIAVVGGWEIITGKGNYSVGDVVVHIQPESMVPEKWAEEWGVTQYLSWRKIQDHENKMGRVRAARLRGLVSFGFLVPNDTGAELETDLAEHYGIVKYDPPQIIGAGQIRSQHPLFHTYTNIQNLRNHPNRLAYGEPLVVTEKIHGTNSRVGLVRSSEDDWELVVGTHRTQRDLQDCGVYGTPLELYKNEMLEIAGWLEQNGESVNSVIFFGEIFGAGIQDLHYGAKTAKGYRLFDISVNGQYLPWSTLEYLTEQYNLPLVPVLTRGMFTFEELVEEAQGLTTLEDEHIREGVVVRPWQQELTWGKGDNDPNPKRMIFKLISSEYLLRKGGTEQH